MLLKLRKFQSTDDGAVTVDWVVLCAAVVLLGATTMTSIKSGAVDLADNTVKGTPGGY